MSEFLLPLTLLLATIPAGGLAISLAGTQLVRRRVQAQPMRDAAAARLAELYQPELATRLDSPAFSAREREFIVRALSARPTPAQLASVSPRATANADQEVPLGSFFLVCPACGTSLGTTADVAHYVGSCPSCSRTVASRRRGSRVSLSAIEAVRP